jgi:isopenicillin N synthase-like dioxygenase
MQEHVDQSLFVIEPCPRVGGLEVFDLHTREWIQVESVLRHGEEWVLFGGRCLEKATGGTVPACLHRVRAANARRFCFISEQKYGEFYE